jgi:hypothetical protein
MKSFARQLNQGTPASNLLSIFLVFMAASPAAASPAVRLLVSNSHCVLEPCPGSPPFSTAVPSGSRFSIFVVALDSGDSPDQNFAGVVRFSSTDPAATLPAEYTFVPPHRGGQGFSVILRTRGDQTITVTDAAGKLLPGSLVMTVLATKAVPTTSGWMKAGFAVVLAIVGLWFGRPRV